LVLVFGIIILYLTGLLEVISQSNTYLASSNGALALSAVYHLVFSAVLTSVLIKNRTQSSYQLSAIIYQTEPCFFFFFAKLFIYLFRTLRAFGAEVIINKIYTFFSPMLSPVIYCRSKTTINNITIFSNN
jgi:hypothetical protein